jgi:hypothetical protein
MREVHLRELSLEFLAQALCNKPLRELCALPGYRLCAGVLGALRVSCSPLPTLYIVEG